MAPCAEENFRLMVGPVIGQGHERPARIASVEDNSNDPIPRPAVAPEREMIKRFLKR